MVIIHSRSKNLDRDWIRRLGQSGKDCYASILARDLRGLGESMNECMRCWEAILPGTVRHRTIHFDLMAILEYYQRRYPGAMYSGCGGGYLFVAADEPVPGGFPVSVRIDRCKDEHCLYLRPVLMICARRRCAYWTRLRAWVKYMCCCGQMR